MKPQCKELLQHLRPDKCLPYVVALIIFLAMTLIYVYPVLEGQRLLQPDIVNWQGMANEINEYREQTGEEALWTNSMFGGMPAFQISVQWANNIANFFHNVFTLWLPRPADMIFLYFAGFFVFLLAIRLNPWIALAGAIAFAFSSYHFIILEAGHNSKAVAIAYMAPVLGTIMLTMRGKLITGGLLFAVFMGLQLFANHFQITYYLALIVVIYGAFELYRHISENQLVAFARKILILVAGLILAIGINIGNFWGTYAYTSETMRGGTELTIRDETVTSGLSKEYITNWSYGIGETFTLLIPNAKGGATGSLGTNETAMSRVDPAFEGIIARENHYWGDQPFTSGPVYVGAVVLFFFFLAFFYIKSPLKWALLAAIVLSIMLSWGKNFMVLTDFFIDYVPGYNKFRAVSMTLVIAELCIPALAFLGLAKFFKEPGDFNFKHKAFLTAAGLSAGISLLFFVAPRLFFPFLSQMESQAYNDLAAREPQMESQIRQVLFFLEEARIAIFRADALRSFFFASAAAVLTLLFAHKKISGKVFIIILILLLTLDMWPINRRYLNSDHFVQKRRVERPFPLRTADQYVLLDNDQVRVIDLTESTFNSSRTSFYHHSIGGYHGAKLQRYQDLIDFHLMEEIGIIQDILRESGSPSEVSGRLFTIPVLNMLNTRYIIYHPDDAPIFNPNALGNAWFAHEVIAVETADEEVLALAEIDPSRHVVVHTDFMKYMPTMGVDTDPEGEIELARYRPNELTYNFRSTREELAVFSEIFYSDGWQAYINGQEAPHFRVNYLLRGMVIPEGEHTISFVFKPRAYHSGKQIALASSILLVVLILGAFISYCLGWPKRERTEQENNQ